MKLSFFDYLSGGTLPPIVFDTPRTEVLRLLGTPSSWVSRDDPLFAKPRRDFLMSDSISYGSLTFSFNDDDRLQSIMLAMALECSWPKEAIHFPASDTTISELAGLMRWREIPFEDVSVRGDGSALLTISGVKIVSSARRSDEGRLLSCHSEKRRQAKTA